MKKRFTVLTVALLAVAPLAACERDEGALERTGEELEQTGEDIGEGVEEGTQETFGD